MSLMIKTYVLDTNVLLNDVEAIYRFEDNIVHVPYKVLQELESKKGNPGIIGFNSREFSKILLDHIENNDEDEKLVIGKGIKQIDFDPRLGNSGDDTILKYCLGLDNPILITKDKYLRVKSFLFGVESQDYMYDKVIEPYSGHTQLSSTTGIIDEIHKNGFIEVDDDDELYPNMCVTLVDEHNPRHTALSIYNSAKNTLERVDKDSKHTVNGISPLNAEQKYALQLLLDPSIELLTIVGATGSGKTLLSIAAALHQVESKIYEQVLITRSETPVGRGQGFLPGDVKEKSDPWLEGLYGCINHICKHKSSDKNEFKPHEMYIGRGIIKPCPIDYVRGVTWNNSILIVDEAQNEHLKIIKTLVTRAGKGKTNTKVVLLGDTRQIDTPYLDRENNGLSLCVEKFKGWDKYGHIQLMKSVRSDLAEEADKRLTLNHY